MMYVLRAKALGKVRLALTLMSSKTNNKLTTYSIFSTKISQQHKYNITKQCITMQKLL